nr:glycosyltransferase [Janibacter melonis]
MPVRTVADWGGVHEWTVDAVRALRTHGHGVTMVGAGDLLEERARAAGADFVVVDWADLEAAASILADAVPQADLIYAHGPQARMIAVDASGVLDIPVHVMCHGAYHDYMYEWAGRVESVSAASPSLMYFVQQVGKVEPWKCQLVANGVDDLVFDLPVIDIDAKLEGGVGRVVTAARLAKDKIRQIDVVRDVLVGCVAQYPDVEWVVDVYGDGPERQFFENSYRMMSDELKNGRATFHGWIPPSDIPRVLNGAAVAVMAGMGGVRSVASGTVTVAAGARDVLGVQVGRNLRAGIFSNFGDHGCPRFEPTPIGRDLQDILRPGRYAEVVELGRSILRRTNSQSVVDGQMLGALQLIQ